ncbi:MAG: cell division protein FtsL [Gammaproteobacteria bacterium]|nr:cell division protein FtsL [Gammaproteobacteria bacterium]
MSRRWLYLALPALWLALLATALGVVRARHEARGLFVQLEQSVSERDRLEIEWGQLQLEQSAWSNHGFVEQVASEKLQMKLPRPDEVRIVAP